MNALILRQTDLSPNIGSVRFYYQNAKNRSISMKLFWCMTFERNEGPHFLFHKNDAINIFFCLYARPARRETCFDLFSNCSINSIFSAVFQIFHQWKQNSRALNSLPGLENKTRYSLVLERVTSRIHSKMQHGKKARKYQRIFRYNWNRDSLIRLQLI